MIDPKNTPVKNLVELIGAFAEMAHSFYSAMIGAGADQEEAKAGMQAFIGIWWTDAMNDARKENDDERYNS